MTDSATAALIDAARRLTERGTPWLAVSQPRYEEPPVCFGCGAKAEAHPTVPELIFFLHDPTCAAVDLVDALAGILASDGEA